MDAAAALLERTGQEEAVTLRAVARQVGVTPTSLYSHFADPQEILRAVVARAFGQLLEALRRPAEAPTDPVGRLLEVSRAYLAFAAERPHLYRVLFERHRTPGTDAISVDGIDTMLGAEAFAVLVDAVGGCVASGDSTEQSPQAGAARVWVALHGLATLRASLPNFPWPPGSELDDLVERAGDLRRGAARGADR